MMGTTSRGQAQIHYRAEWGSSPWVELETVRATIEAYSKGEIKLPPERPGTRDSYRKKTDDDQTSSDVCQATDTRHYTKTQIAEFLGWTRKSDRGNIPPDYKWEVAFAAIKMIERGLLMESHTKGLTRTQLQTLVRVSAAVYNDRFPNLNGAA
jgi:hypothetical protein